MAKGDVDASCQEEAATIRLNGPPVNAADMIFVGQLTGPPGVFDRDTAAQATVIVSDVSGIFAGDVAASQGRP